MNAKSQAARLLDGIARRMKQAVRVPLQERDAALARFCVMKVAADLRAERAKEQRQANAARRKG